MTAGLAPPEAAVAAGDESGVAVALVEGGFQVDAAAIAAGLRIARWGGLPAFVDQA